MLYSNISLLPLGDGETYADLGKAFKIGVRPEIEACEVIGMRRDLSILPEPVPLKIGKLTDNTLYLILSSYREDPSFGYGSMRIPASQEKKVLYGKHLYPNSNNTATYDAVVVEAKPGDIFRVSWSGYLSMDYPSTFYIVENGLKIASVDQPNVAKYFEKVNKKMPFSLPSDGILLEEWKPIVR